MSGIAKKIITAVIIFALTATPTLTVFAASANGHNPPGQQQKQDNEDKQKGNSQNASGSQSMSVATPSVATPSANPQKTEVEGDKQPKQTDDHKGPENKNPGKENAADHKAGQNSHAQLDITAIENAIASNSDMNTQSSLLTLLAAYQKALDVLQNARDSQAGADIIKADRDAVVSAQSALLKGLYASGIKLAMVLGNGAENKAGQNADGQLDVSSIQTTIDALNDPAAQSSLKALLAAYQTAQNTLRKDLYGGASGQTLATDRAAIEAAKTALLEALSAAQAATPSPSPSPSPSVSEAPQSDELDIAAIQASIANLDDINIQVSLLGMVTAYQSALDTLQNDLTNNASADALQADRDALQAAKDALQSGLAGAGIALPGPSASPSPSPSASEAPTVSETAQIQTQSSNTIWDSIVNWFTGLFGQQSN